MVGFANVMLVTKTVREGTEVKDLEILPKDKKTRQNIEVGGTRKSDHILHIAFIVLCGFQ